jgi:hypothetical protein
MIARRLDIENIGCIEKETIKLNKPLILFYGDIKQGKTTILNAVKWLFGGSFPADIIRHGQKEASVKIVFDEGSITREWYVNSEGVTVARPIVFILGDKKVKSPVEEIKKFLNPYLLDNEYLKKMNDTERNKYFVQLFGIDTSDIDKEYAKADADAKELRAKIKGYGEINLVEIEPVDVAALKAKRDEIVEVHRVALTAVDCKLSTIRQAHQNEVDNIKNMNILIRDNNSAIGAAEVAKLRLVDEITELETKLKTARKALAEKEAFLLLAQRQEEIPEPPAPDTTAIELRLREQADTADIDEQISQAAVANVRYEQYQKDVARANQKKADENTLSALVTKLADLKKQKVAKLASISETCGIPGFSFDESGNFIYDNTQAGMLSTSQIMNLSAELSSLYPAGFGLELVDRAESLGKSIFGFIERAKAEEKSILATIVGEKPASVPEDVGVFIVSSGIIE